MMNFRFEGDKLRFLRVLNNKKVLVSLSILMNYFLNDFKNYELFN